MFNEYYQLANELKSRGEPFAAVTVVRNEAPSSGKTGDKAIVGRDGVLKGWVGGGCVYSIVIKEVRDALADGKPRLVRVSPTPDAMPTPGIKEYKMTCYSGGAVDLFIEPVLPKPHLILIGKSVIGRALLKIARAADFRVTIVTDDASPEAYPDATAWQTEFDLGAMPLDAQTFIVVATQGDNDERGLETALSVSCRYVGFVTSRKKRESIFENLRLRGVSGEKLQTVHAPAGLDLNAKTPEEVAITILAEIIQEFRTHSTELSFQETKPQAKKAAEKRPAVAAPPAETASARPLMVTNPVCGLPISAGMAKYTVEVDGRPIYFCCDGCKVKFDADPEKYIALLEKEETV